MQNIDVRFTATGNFAAVEAQLAALQAKVAAFQQQLMKSGTAHGTGNVDAKRWKAASLGVSAMSDAYRMAAASSGLLEASQLRVNSETSRYTELLQKQKLSMRDIVKQRRMMGQVYRDQLKLQRMTVTSRGIDKFGREISDITVPTNVTRELDTINKRLRFTRSLIGSASNQMINWGKNTQWAGRQLTVGLTMPMAMFAAAAGKMAYDVDKQLTRVAKVYDSTLGKQALSADKARELETLRTRSFAMARDMAKEYGAAITDVIDVEAQLAATGLSGERLMGGTAETVRIAALGEVDFTQATDMTVALQTAFKDTIKTTEDLTKVFDYMNYVENTTSLSIQDIAEATPRAASGLASLGVTAQEMTIMLVAMREAGIDAAEGANALKSASTRILNVVPEAEDKFAGLLKGKWTSVQQIADAAGGNLFEFLQLLSKATAGMSDLDKQKGIAKLFGTYQYNRLNAALKGVTDTVFGLGDGTSQAAKAFAGLQMSASELAAVSAGEVAKQAASSSGQFKRAMETFKIELATAGEAMLPVGTAIIDVIGRILSAGVALADAIPDWMKPFAKWFVAITAVAGPTIMLAGLMGNLIGWAMKFVGMGAKFNIVNRAQQAAAIQAANTRNAYVSEAESVALLTSELNALAAAQGYSIGIAKQAQATALSNMGMTTSAAGQIGKARSVVGQAAGVDVIKESKNIERYTGPIGPMTRMQTLEYEKLNAQRTKGANIENSIANTQRRSAALTGAMGIAMAGTLATSGKLQSTLIGVTTALIAAQALSGTGLGKAIAGAWTGSKTTGAMSKFSAAGSKTFSKMGSLATRFGRLLISPWGAAAAAVIGVGWLIHKQMQKPIEQQEAINRSVDAWADTLDVVKKKYAGLDLSLNQYADTSITTKELSERLLSSDDGKKLVDFMKKGLEEDPAAASMTAAQEYIKILTQTNASSEDAMRGIEALYLATGMGFIEASERAAELRAEIGNTITGIDMKELWSAQVGEALEATGELFETRVEGIANMLETELMRAGSPRGADKVLLNFGATIDEMSVDNWRTSLTDGLKTAFSDMDVSDVNTQFDMLEAAAEISSNKIAEAMGADIRGFDALENTQEFADKYNISLAQANTLIAEAGNLSEDQIDKLAGVHNANQQVLDTIAARLGIEEKVNSVLELRATEEWQIFQITEKNAKARISAFQKEIQAQVEFMGGQNTIQGRAAAIGNLERLNLRLRKVGMDAVYSVYDDINWAQLESLEKEQKQKSADNARTQRLKEALKVWKEFSKTGIVDSTKTGWQNTVAAVAEQASADLAASQEASLNALENASERESRMLDARAEHWSDFYDKAIDNAEKYYDHRIERINNVIEAEERANDIRQRIFEAEQTRLQREADAQNRNIEFNMALNEGRLDEAARIMNQSAVDAAKDQMDDELKRGDAELDTRKASLEGQIELLEKQRDRKIENLENAREMKEKAIDAARERYEIEADMQRDALEAQHQRERAAQERGLALLRAFIPRNKKELIAYMRELDDRYNTFGGNLKARASEWGNFIGNEQNHQLQIAANNMKSEVNWAGAGFDAANGMLKGMATAMGFDNVSELRKWMGISMKGGKRPKNKNGTMFVNESKGARGLGENTIASYHTGGSIGRDTGGRTGFTGAQSRHNEVTINAQRGEYMINKKAAARYGKDNLDRINDGSLAIGGPSSISMMGAMVPLLARSMYGVMFGSVKEGAENAVANKNSSMSSLLGMLGTAGAGTYGDTVFTAEQLRNAGIIAGVGQSMGMSQRDIVIGLMTAMQESMLRNVDYGDRDSLGLFQQRPSMGWGTPAQVTDPEYAARKFFSVLNTIEDRDTMPLTYAAQAVQRSAYPTAYAKWEDEARAILAAMAASGGGVAGGFIQGPGGRHRPVTGGTITQGLHYNNAIDIGVPVGSPVYSVADGRVAKSYDIIGHEPRAPHGGLGYRSYGRVIEIDHGNFSTLSAHLSSRAASTGQTVKGGAVIGRSGNTGNSFGPHLHFEGHGISPYAFLKKGGTVKNDNTPAILHKNERVLTADLTAELDNGIQNLSKLDVQALAYAIKNFVAETKGAAAPGRKRPGGKSAGLPDSNEAFGVRTGTYNLYRKAANPRTMDDLQRLMKMSDVLSLTEYIGNKRALGGWIRKQGWGIHAAGGSDDTAVIWDKSDFDFISGGSRMLNNNNRTGAFRDRKAAYARLRDKKSGREFYQVSAHTVGHAQRGNPGWKNIMNDQYAGIRNLVGDLKKSGIPVFLAGDFNTNAKRSDIPLNFGLGHMAGMGLDRIYATMAQAAGMRRVSGLSSDHDAILASLNIPSLAKGGHLQWDNMLVNGHAGETMLTKDLSDKFKQGVNNFANGGNTDYTVVVDLRGSYIKEDVDIEKAVNTAIDKRESKVGRKRVVR